jgi:hypothetical protein
VRPVEDFWRVLAEAEIDVALHRENRWQVEQRTRQLPVIVVSSQATAAEQSAYAADVAMGSAPKIPDHFTETARNEFEKAAQSRVGATESSIEQARAALEQESKLRPYRLEFVDNAHAPFYEPDWVGAQVVVRLNRRHPFYQVLYGDLLKLHGAGRAKETVDLLLITLAKAELTVDNDEMSVWYAAQRKHRWSPFLETAVRSLEQRWENPEEESEEDEGSVA